MNKYTFRPSQTIFSELFESEKQRLNTFLNGNYIIEHVGSTAIPGLGGKNIIDIYIVAPDSELQDLKEGLEKAGYEFRALIEPDQHKFFRIDLPDPIETTRRYHVHINSDDSEDFKEVLLFRDYLRSHPVDVKEYAEIKQEAGEESNNDRDTYMRIKSPIILKILNKAKTTL